MKPRLFKSRASLDAFLARQKGKGGALHILVLHTDACSPIGCVCRPKFLVQDLTPTSAAVGEACERAWIRETGS